MLSQYRKSALIKTAIVVTALWILVAIIGYAHTELGVDATDCPGKQIIHLFQ